MTRMTAPDYAVMCNLINTHNNHQGLMSVITSIDYRARLTRSVVCFMVGVGLASVKTWPAGAKAAADGSQPRPCPAKKPRERGRRIDRWRDQQPTPQGERGWALHAGRVGLEVVRVRRLAATKVGPFLFLSFAFFPLLCLACVETSYQHCLRKCLVCVSGCV